MFVIGVVPEQVGVEDEEEEADIEVKDVAHDDTFFEVLELDEFGGDSSDRTDDFLEVRVMNDCD